MTTFATELSELWLCGRSYLPQAANAIMAANAAVAGPAPGPAHRAPIGGDAAKFMRPGMVGPSAEGRVTGQVFPVWNALRNELQRVLAQSADNLFAAGDALVRIADMYAATDAEAAEELGGIQRQYIESGAFYIENPENRPRPRLPE